MSAFASARSFLKYSAIRAGLEAVALSPSRSLWPAAAGRGLIFTLHHVRPPSEAFSPNALLSVTPEFLDAAIRTSLEEGLTPVALEDLPRRLADEPERRFVCFTLDDGFRDNAEHAAPVFRRHGAPYTIFLTQGFVERTRTLWWETAEALVTRNRSVRFDFGEGVETLPLDTAAQKQGAFLRFAGFVASAEEDAAVARIDRAARAYGIDPDRLAESLTMSAAEIGTLAQDPLARFGAHTVTHANLRRVPQKRLEHEIAASIDAVERFTAKRPTSFAFPYGFEAAAGEREFKAAKDAGLELAVTTRPGVIRDESLANPTALPRVSLNGLFQKKRYVRALISGVPFKLM
ncbi:MAG TPA: polysaccharide deacetylase family protein [Mesorhizobium sp.]|jgi:peptidoglycan/xylan/chitin deacetylase (PgdA/CDA1 family)|nr:polysaccharide deacetylase family protein [Mesorhizobium sp.]